MAVVLLVVEVVQLGTQMFMLGLVRGETPAPISALDEIRDVERRAVDAMYQVMADHGLNQLR
jgi:hypothetical protein